MRFLMQILAGIIAFGSLGAAIFALYLGMRMLYEVGKR